MCQVRPRSGRPCTSTRGRLWRVTAVGGTRCVHAVVPLTYLCSTPAADSSLSPLCRRSRSGIICWIRSLGSELTTYRTIYTVCIVQEGPPCKLLARRTYTVCFYTIKGEINVRTCDVAGGYADCKPDPTLHDERPALSSRYAPSMLAVYS
jgi:hypothetical protein